MERDPCDGKEASPAETSWSPEIPNHWIEAQDSLKRSLVTEDDFTWKLPRDTNTATASALGGGEVCRVLKYVGGVDISFSKVDPSIACGTLVVLDLLTLEVVYDDFSVVRLHIPYVPGFLAFREFTPLLQILNHKVSCLGFGLACHLGVLANLPTIGIGKNLHHVDGLSQSRVRQLLEAKGNLPEDIITLSGDSGSIWGAAMRSTQGSFKPIFISVGHRVSLATAVEIAKMTCKYRVPEPIRQADVRSRDYLRKHQLVQ
ncbi:hypothetical protein TEA_019773 [Camellia sinensis var. sinensis]|uniref:Endonuclease V n=1 Tax=Camellia sinensis var. sinensis TaxID=542762 RepID=A0A4S4DSJ5_CAMSN|nr:hypothetical protein TEA_019773 [Camellia sinensis var. sinensis]